MLIMLLISCLSQETQIQKEESFESPISMNIRNITDDQKEVALVVEKELDEINVSKNIIAAAIVNAVAESKLNPEAIGDKGKSVGVFQLHKNGLGNKLSVEERKNVSISTYIVGIQILKDDKLSDRDSNGASISELASIITEDIMRPKEISKEKTTRSNIAKNMFPSRIVNGEEW